MSIRSLCLTVGLLVPLLAQSPSVAAQNPASVEERLQRLEERQTRLEAELLQKDARIQELETQLVKEKVDVGSTDAIDSPSSTATVAAADAATTTARDPTPKEGWGHYEPGRGFVVARTGWGELDFSAYAYARYINQKGLDETYTDSFGTTRNLDLRSDLQFQKVLLYFKGWALDPKLRYLLYTWTTNSSQGNGAQVVVAGNISYAFNDMFDVGVGIGGLPTTRSTSGNFPNWLRVDNRTVADDYFRGSYTSGIWSSGKLSETTGYQLMIGNNLSQLGVDAAQLDNVFNTLSGALWWMPTTGEFGPRSAFGDFEHHDELATRFGLHYTRSREDAQNQPGVDDPDNAQIRLSDGSIIFRPELFGPGTRVDKVTYEMAALEAGLKYRGFALEGEYYWRRLDDFSTVGVIPFDKVTDNGFQLQASAMLMPKTVQAYVSGSKIYGDNGDPWDVALGVSWFPYQTRNLRANTQVLFLDDSPVGSTSTPSVVGGDGPVYTVDLELIF